MNKKIYVVTGATSGIGKELVALLSRDNMIFAGYRDESKIVELPNVTYFYINMTDRNSIVKAAEFIKSKTSHVDVLINVAGGVVAGPCENIDTDRLRAQFDLNTFSHIEFSQNLVNILENGMIINVSSMASYGHFPFISPYCASKRALDIFFNAFMLENHKNIKVVSVKPGVIATPLWQKSVDNNLKYLDECAGYEKELNFIKNNALKNSSRGLNVVDVAKFIRKISNMKNPRLSYDIGVDAKLAHLLSFIPSGLRNKIIKFGMNARIK